MTPKPPPEAIDLLEERTRAAMSDPIVRYMDERDRRVRAIDAAELRLAALEGLIRGDALDAERYQHDALYHAVAYLRGYPEATHPHGGPEPKWSAGDKAAPTDALIDEAFYGAGDKAEAPLDPLAVGSAKCEVCGKLADGEPGRCHLHFRRAEPTPTFLGRPVDRYSGGESGRLAGDKAEAPAPDHRECSCGHFGSVHDAAPGTPLTDLRWPTVGYGPCHGRMEGGKACPCGSFMVAGDKAEAPE